MDNEIPNQPPSRVVCVRVCVCEEFNVDMQKTQNKYGNLDQKEEEGRRKEKGRTGERRVIREEEHREGTEEKQEEEEKLVGKEEKKLERKGRKKGEGFEENEDNFK